MELKTKKGESFFIDDEDYDLIKHITWCKNIGYVRGYCKIDKKLIYLHRVIMGVSKDKTKMIDHKNGDRSDNRKENLRLCTYSENLRNKSASGKSKYLGVGIHITTVKRVKKNGDLGVYISKPKFISRIRGNGKNINLGLFTNEIDAAKAYNEAAIKYHGEFANLNTFD